MKEKDLQQRCFCKRGFEISSDNYLLMATVKGREKGNKNDRERKTKANNEITRLYRIKNKATEKIMKK